MRQGPETDNDRMMRRWRCWAICTHDGVMAELTMDPDKAHVWKKGGHRVIEFVHEEPLYEVVDPSAGSQGTLL